jgi:hypothetical protein
LIYEKDLDESIAKYQGEPNPSISTCIKLAACMTLKRELFGNAEQPPPPQVSQAGYSYAPGDGIKIDSDTDFAQAIQGRNPDEIWPIMDELMSTLKITHKRLYEAVMRRL